MTRPLDFGQRCERYAKQTGGTRLTPRQRRRANKKARHASTYRFALRWDL